MVGPHYKSLSDYLEELAIIGARLVTGFFLVSLRSNLKTLILEDSNCVRINFLQLALHRLTGLKRLELNSLTDEILQNAHLLLYKMPHLEYLSLTNFYGYNRINLSALLPALCRLSSLRELYLNHDSCVTGEWIEAVGRGCPALRVVDIGFCLYVGGRSVVALCRARPELTELSVCRIPVTDMDVQASVNFCADLEFLDLSWCYSVTRTLTGHLAWPRPRPLRLRLFGNRAEKKAQYEGIKILRDRPPHTPKRY
ncbi:hypothetical protein MSG28_015063 [Choristoneura fumiferana]|uniref:Uncharacterized protein n=1 Tax=Choristoneura fumiferana TaxID=7141 RepID=A0ACC0KY42_CHOFU|nr:hypothetical protein MSG28_015063 [Choristoneura fumiferana]